MLFKSAKKSKKQEERKYERIEFYQSSYYRFNKKDEKTYECWFNNISLGGMCIDTDNGNVKLDEVIKVLYKIETKIRYDECKVRYMTKALNNWRYGCEFVREDPQRDELIKRYIDVHMLNKQ